MNDGEQEISLRRSQQQRNYLMYHHDESLQNNQNHRRIGGQKKPLISRDNRNQGGKGPQSNAFKPTESNKMSNLRHTTYTRHTRGLLRGTSPKNSKRVHQSKKNRPSFKNRENHRQRALFEIPECDPSTGCVNVTKTFATLGRTASMNCFAENLVGQKTVSKLI